MKIDLIAYTTSNAVPWDNVLEDTGFVLDDLSREAEDLIEFAGRLCYESYGKPNEATKANKDYLANVALQKHFSVFEHASATFLFRDVSRALTHELVRHRHFSYSQVSQRYVDSSDRDFVDHPVWREHNLDPNDWIEPLAGYYAEIVNYLVSKGLSRKEARGAARLVLPEGTTTDIVVSGNFRSWLEFIEKRNSKFADAEIRELAAEVQRQLQKTFPNAFQDSIINKQEDRPVPVSLKPEVKPLTEDEKDLAEVVKQEVARALKELFN